jgi:hypothetical protein
MISQIVTNTRYQIKTPSGYQNFTGVQKITKPHKVKVSFNEDVTPIECSPDHPFVCPSGSLIKAINLMEGDPLPHDTLGYVTIKAIQYIKEKTELYDILDAGNEKLFYANGVLTHNCEFFGSTKTLISASKLKILASSYVEPKYSQDGLDIHNEPFTDQSVDPRGNVIFIPRKYAIVADTAKGKFLDYSAFVVFDITEIPYRVVAKYRNNAISPIEFPNVLYNIAKKYNEAFVLLEINDVGNQVAQALAMDMEYENVLKVTPNGRGGQHLATGYAKSTQLGLNMTNPVKIHGCTNLKTIIEREKLLICDFDIIKELTTFVKDGKSFSADDGTGAHDDLVMCLVSFAWMVQDKYFRDLVDLDLREKMRKDNERSIEFSQLPFGFKLDGLTEYQTGEKFDSGDSSVWFSAGSSSIYTEDREENRPPRRPSFYTP